MHPYTLTSNNHNIKTCQVSFDLSLAQSGLDYYTGLVIEPMLMHNCATLILWIFFSSA